MLLFQGGSFKRHYNATGIGPACLSVHAAQLPCTRACVCVWVTEWSSVLWCVRTEERESKSGWVGRSSIFPFSCASSFLPLLAFLSSVFSCSSSSFAHLYFCLALITPAHPPSLLLLLLLLDLCLFIKRLPPLLLRFGCCVTAPGSALQQLLQSKATAENTISN